MKKKVIALTDSSNLLDNLENKENALELLLKLSHGTIKTRPFGDTLKGLLISPTTLTQSGITRLTKKLENELCNMYIQKPLAYIRLSTNITMLQRIMTLEQATSLNLLADYSLKKSIYLALSSKLTAFGIPIERFLSEMSKYSRYIEAELRKIWAEKNQYNLLF